MHWDKTYQFSVYHVFAKKIWVSPNQQLHHHASRSIEFRYETHHHMETISLEFLKTSWFKYIVKHTLQKPKVGKCIFMMYGCIISKIIFEISNKILNQHDCVIIWKHFPRYWPFVREFHRSPVNSPYKGQWRGALMFSFICAWINSWVNNRKAGDLRRHRVNHDVIVMYMTSL